MARERLLNSARLSALLGDGGLDAIIASSPANLFYVSGTMIISHRPSSHRLEMAILSPRHDPTLIICQIEESLTRHDSWVHDIRPYVLFQTKPMDLMAQVIREKGFARGRLGIEKRYIRAEYLAELARALPEARIDGCDDLFDRARAVKTPGEIRRLTDAAVATETAIERSLAATRLGCTERELAERLSVQVAELGADDSYHVVAAGDRTAFPFNRAGLAALEPGDLVRVQSIGSFDGYAAVATRLAVVGEPSTSQCDTYSRVCEIQEAVIRQCRPGLQAADLFAYTKRTVEQAGLQFTRPYVGYSFGLGEQERPILGPAEEWELEANMVLAVGPFLHADGPHYQVEDLVLLTDTGTRRLSGRSVPAPLAVIE